MNTKQRRVAKFIVVLWQLINLIEDFIDVLLDVFDKKVQLTK